MGKGWDGEERWIEKIYQNSQFFTTNINIINNI
jgi:hypothetical protein